MTFFIPPFSLNHIIYSLVIEERKIHRHFCLRIGLPVGLRLDYVFVYLLHLYLHLYLHSYLAATRRRMDMVSTFIFDLIRHRDTATKPAPGWDTPTCYTLFIIVSIHGNKNNTSSRFITPCKPPGSASRIPCCVPCIYPPFLLPPYDFSLFLFLLISL